LKSIAGGDADANAGAGAGADIAPANGAVNYWDSCFVLLIIIFNKTLLVYKKLRMGDNVSNVWLLLGWFFADDDDDAATIPSSCDVEKHKQRHRQRSSTRTMEFLPLSNINNKITFIISLYFSHS
jgi:hypothetical protein